MQITLPKISLRNLLILVIVILIAASTTIIIKRRAEANQPVFSPRDMIESLWHRYKGENLEPESLRALDKEQNFITTSEGQSYTLLRAVWVNDRETFDTAWQWTKDNLQHSNDSLFAWKFGQRKNGTYGILTQEGGNNSATDADVDIALALLFASERWNDDTYFGDAMTIINDIWDKEVVVINGRPFLAANDLEKSDKKKKTIIVNPSYLAPYAYRIFEEVDPRHDWMGLVDSSYDLIEDNMVLPLDTNTSAGIPSDWITVDKKTGKIAAITGTTTLKTNFSYDALRLPWRLALDAKWFNEPRATKLLQDMAFFTEEWNSRKRVYANYTHDGQIAEWSETPAMYGGLIGYFMITDPEIAKEVYYKKLESLYNVDTFNWTRELGYYDKNWAWFGLALYNDLLPQLYPLSKTN